ncbi:MAG: alginate export family protein, partial [Planctomycetota bacterium]
RTLRAIPPRDQFKVTGEVRAVDRERGRLDVGGVPLTVAPDVDLEVGGRRDPDDPLALFLADDQKAVPFSLRLSDSLRLGGQAAAESEWEDEFDLDAGRDRDRTKPSFGGKLDALWLLDDRGSYALGEVAFGRSDVLREGGVDSHEDKLELTRAFASLAVAADLQLLVGRQDFDEGREWLYDEVLDGVRAVFRRGPLELEAGVAAGREVAAEDNAYEDTGVWLANARWHLDPASFLGAYVLQRTDDSAAGFEPLLFGVRSHREVRQGLGHWLELGLARGRAGGRDVDGYAFDAGCLFTFDTAWRPALAAGLAHGSGRADGDTASGYRQSGLQDNNAKVGGVTSVRYYGELLDPELANLRVATAAVAVRPFAGASLSLLWHGYRQDVAATGSPDSSLRTTPNGTSRDLGQELDLVFGYRAARRFTLELVYARFEPGSAFAADTGADLIAFTTRLSF